MGNTMASLKAILRACWLSSRSWTLSIRGWFAAKTQALPVSSLVLGPPKGLYETSQAVETWYRQTLSHPFTYSYKKIFSLEEIRRTPPQTIDQNIHWKFRSQYQQKSPETFLVEIEEGRFCVDRKGKFYSAVITADDKVIGDLSSGFTSPSHPIFSELKLPKFQEINDSIVILSDTSDSNYFHWLLDALPRLHLLEVVGISLADIPYIGIVSRNNSFRQETLAMLRINPNKIIELKKYPHIKAKKLIVPSFPGQTGNPPAWSCRFLRSQLLPYAAPKCSTQNLRRIYISRNDARYRRVTNEPEIVEILQGLGFELVKLQFLSVTEQISLFLNAEVVISPHGAGLANVVFCRPGTKVIELFAPSYVNVCYWALSQQVDVDYYYLIGEGNLPATLLDIYESRKNISINLEKLKKILATAELL